MPTRNGLIGASADHFFDQDSIYSVFFLTCSILLRWFHIDKGLLMNGDNLANNKINECQCMVLNLFIYIFFL